MNKKPQDKYISNSIDLTVIDRRNFNIIASGTGTGKTYFIANELRRQLPNIKAHEIMFIASRALIVDQQSRVEGVDKFHLDNISYIKHWRGEEGYLDIVAKKGIQIMTYDKIIEILRSKNIEGLETLSNVKLIVFDECHTLFSDKFIKDIEMLKVWIRDNVYIGDKIFLGLTATPNIIAYYQREWGVPVKRINNDILIKYKAKQLHCTDFDTIPYIVINKLEGKTLIMCYSHKDCIKLNQKIPNSFVMLSKSNKHFTQEMDRIRNHIVSFETLPETFIDTDGEEKELNVLITTSTLREGVNIRKESGIKNVVCCFSDELHITQFVGRARYSVDNLVVADTYINADNYNRNSYLAKCRLAFRAFMKSKDHTSWFDSISHLVEHDIYEVRRFILTKDEKRFIDYINSKWLVPKGITDKKTLDKYRIYKDEHKQEIIKMVADCKLLKLYPSYITFNKVIHLMQDSLGYEVDGGRFKQNNHKYTYKIIIDFDEYKAIYSANNKM